MPTASTSTAFGVYARGDLYLVRIVGPGIWRESGRFENLLTEVEARHPGRVVIDLSECPRIDSTFAGAFERLSDRALEQGYAVYVAGAQGPVAELLDTLFLGETLPVVPLPDSSSLAEVEIRDRDLSKEQVMALSLDGHERLAALNDANARRFAALLEVLREQLPSHRKPEP